MKYTTKGVEETVGFDGKRRESVHHHTIVLAFVIVHKCTFPIFDPAIRKMIRGQ